MVRNNRDNHGLVTRPTTENNMVVSLNTSDIIKRSSKYFVSELGLASTMSVEGVGTVNNIGDSFATFYRRTFNRNVFLKGRIGNISIYFDPYVPNDKILFWLNGKGEEFTIDLQTILSTGVDSIIGQMIHDLKNADTSTEDAFAKSADIGQGDASKLTKNPGRITASDIMAYLDSKRKTI